MSENASPAPLRVTVWNEFRHERKNPAVAAIYPNGIHECVAGVFRDANAAAGAGDAPEFAVRTATLDEPEHGLPPAVLDATDVLIWWGHEHHREVADEVVARVHARVLEGMGLVVLHSAHLSKIFKALMGTSCSLKWREANDKERLWVVNPAHAVAAGLPEYFELPAEEMYGEPFGIPEPDELVFVSWFTGGEVFRSGACWRRGGGRVFYFRPGHETYPTYHDANVRRVLLNAVRWARPAGVKLSARCPNTAPLEPLPVAA
ncbi:MAG: ThuA domain-containing protein [Puniceicoccales bacterium]|jgi:trehalose utilization protein|nr:ThuA domain-containing protein [Puniceicoccales bacterium]